MQIRAIGLWNGFIEAVCGIISLIQYIFEALAFVTDLSKNFNTMFPIILEKIDDIILSYQQIDFEKIINKLAESLKNWLTSDFTVSLVEIAYFSGAFIGFVVELAIEIAVGILVSGGVISIEAVLVKLGEVFVSFGKILLGIIKLPVTAAKTTFTALLNGLHWVYEFLAKGTDEILKIIDEVFAKLKQEADDLVKIVKTEVDSFIAKVPKGVAQFINILPKEIQKRIVNGLLVLEFQGKTIAKLNPKGIFVEITYFREAKNFTQIAELKSIKLELNIVDDSGKIVVKKYVDSIEVVKKGNDGKLGFRTTFEEGKVRDADYMNYTHEKSGGNPPYQTNPRSKANVIDKILKEGDEFYVVEYLNQGAPGGFLSKEPIFTIKDLRQKLAVIEDWKDPKVDQIVIRKYKVLQDIPVRDGNIGSMLETSKNSKNFGKIYKGGGHQYEALQRFSTDDIFIKGKSTSFEGKKIEIITEFTKTLKK